MSKTLININKKNDMKANENLYCKSERLHLYLMWY